MNADSNRQDSEVSEQSFLKLLHPEEETHQQQIESVNPDYSSNDPYAFPSRCSNTTDNPGRNKRKNFYPRYTSKYADENDQNLDVMNTTPSNANPESRDDSPYPQNKNENVGSSLKSPLSQKFTSSIESSPASVADACSSAGQNIELPPWVQMFNHYDQLVKAAGLAQYHVANRSSGCHDVGTGDRNAMQIAVSDMSKWVSKFGNSESAISAVHDLFKAYQGGKQTPQDGNGSAHLSTETEPPTPPTTPFACNSSRSVLKNDIFDYYDTPIKKEIHQISSPPKTSANSIGTNNSNSISIDKRKSHIMSQQTNNDQWTNDSKLGQCSLEKRKKKDYSAVDEDDDYNKKAMKTEAECFNSYDDDSSDCCDREHARQGTLSDHLLQWCEDFQKTPESVDKRIKSECDDTNTTVGDGDNNLYDEDDYPPSPNDFPDSANDDEDYDDNYGMSLFYDDEQQTVDDQMKITEFRRNDTESVPSAAKYDNRDLKSSKLSNRGLKGFLEKSQLNLAPSKLRGGINEKSFHKDFVQNMNKFTSYLECQNEICRMENLREHYHCYDFPCFGKILSKKEEVIRHVKWHRKRIESLNHGFMRFSSSDDCSTTFGNNCQHNRKQTHYHCFQPNCDRVYISTSDVQMHSNFHRKDSAIHKEGFQRFRANEQCSADYCMFAGQKTTHFHCRRDNCRYTFKNKADMEKHKTYHIKDLKLARDGFKKFLKNEACPYKQCRFSKVCNHIHCARENCFYVLHSSGQLLSHKRKHERMDNEQTYCRYKMLAVKAALLGNAATAAATTVETSSYNSLLQLSELEISAFVPRTNSQPSFLSQTNESLQSENPSFSVEFLQQMKTRHEELLKQKQQIQILPESTALTSGDSEKPMFQRAGDPQLTANRYNMAMDSSYISPSVIQKFFTTDCQAGEKASDKPINLKNFSANDESQNREIHSCPWEARLEPHLHCIVKNCKGVIPNNILDISAHIRIHEYNRNVYAMTSAGTASGGALSSADTGTSRNPMQITTIDGFFNRKRGRPPKNRFVEVYKNAQQSPQAIFTSFKLEKHTMNKDCNTRCDIPANPSCAQLGIEQQRKGHSVGENRLMNLSLSQPPLAQTSTFAENPILSQYTTHNANEQCGLLNNHCSLTMQHHYHCACSADCAFITAERDLLSVHLERQHTTQSFADIISKNFKRFDRNIGLDCEIADCRLRKTRPHLHCRQCYRQISPFDLETHTCVNAEQQSTPLSPTKKLPTFYSPEYHNTRTETQLQNEFLANNIKSYARLPAVTFHNVTDFKLRASDTDLETSTLPPKHTHEDEKVLVVRAAGTFFPENTNELSGTSQHKSLSSPMATECIQVPISITTGTVYCSTPYCKMKRKPHEHCEFCEQSFVDASKMKAHRVKHIGTTNKIIPIDLMSQHSTTTGEDNKQPQSSNDPRSLYKFAATYDDQPQDLSLPLNNALTSTENDMTKPTREPVATTPIASDFKLAPSHFSNLFPPDLMCGISSIQNFHLAQLATLYQQNPYYYQHLYPFLSNAAVLSRTQQHRQTEPYQISCNAPKPYLPAVADCSKTLAPTEIPPLPTPSLSAPSTQGRYPFLSPLLMPRKTETVATKQMPLASLASSVMSIPPGKTTSVTTGAIKGLKRKHTIEDDNFSAFIDALPPSTKKQMQFAAGLAAAAAVAAATSGQSGCTSTTQEQHGQHFKIKDEQIPTGYLKFRFNEDCYFPKCGYRNHQSHFHCDRNDCHYSFCDKTRFVQHTARHERLDKLMGNDFRQYRANMNCGYENCPYFKNLGSANKSSHFHCLKCDFICSDTNKVVAHRRQHSKMEYIRMAGFRKVTNNEKCNSTFEATVPTNGSEMPGTIECSYSQKQTHYHCLVCDVSVLSRAQLSSHKHKT